VFFSILDSCLSTTHRGLPREGVHDDMKRTIALVGLAFLALWGCAIENGTDETAATSSEALQRRAYDRTIVHSSVDPSHALTGATSVAHTGATGALDGPHVGPGDPVEVR
jgi:hypothetical protein